MKRLFQRYWLWGFGSVIILVSVGVFVFGGSTDSKKAKALQRAGDFFAAADYDSAKIEYMNVLKIDRKNLVALTNLGQILFDQGSPGLAYPFLKTAVELDEGNLELRHRWMLSLLGNGDLEKARNEAWALLVSNPEDQQAAITFIETAKVEKELRECEAEINKLAKVQPDSAAISLAHASIAVKRGKLTSAETMINRALELDPQSVPAHLAKAKLHLSRDEETLARAAFQRGVSLSPPRSLSRLKYGKYLMSRGELKDARAELEPIANEQPGFLPTWNLLAEISLREGNYDEAVEFLKRVMTKDAKNFDALLLQARILLAQGENEQGLDAITRIKSGFGSTAAIEYHLAMAYLVNGNNQLAIEALERAVALEPHNADAQVLLAQLNLQRGKPLEVVSSMNDLLNERPGYNQAEQLQAMAYRSARKYKEAAEIYQLRLKRNPKDIASYLQLGTVLRESGNLVEARRIFEESLKAVPANPAPALLLATMDLAERKFDSAIAQVESVIKLHPDLADAHLLLGKIYVGQENWVEAEKALTRTIELNPKVAQPYNLLIAVYRETGRSADAMKQLEHLVAERPGDLPKMTRLAMFYSQSGELNKARQLYEDIVKIDDTFTPALNDLAWLYSEHFNQLDKAHALATSARELQPEDPAIADTLGWIEYRLGRYEAALGLIIEGAAKLSEISEVQYHLGLAHYAMGNETEARTALDTALKSSSSKGAPWTVRANEQLQFLNDGQATIDQLNQRLEGTPDDLIAWLRVARKYEENGQTDAAREAYERALKMNPKLIAATVGLIRLYHGPLDNRTKALELATSARSTHPTHSTIAGLLGVLEFEDGNFQRAVTLLKDASSDETPETWTLVSLGSALYAIGDVSGARNAMQKASERPNLGGEKERVAKFLLFTDPATTVEPSADLVDLAEQTLNSKPDQVPALMIRAAAKAKLGQVDHAIADYQMALKVHPEFAPAMRDLAAVYLQLPDKLTEAHQLAVAARKILDNDLILAKTLGIISHLRGNHDYAILLLQSCDQANRLDAESRFYLGKSQIAEGKKQEGIASVKKAVVDGLGEPMVSEANSILKPKPND